LATSIVGIVGWGALATPTVSLVREPYLQLLTTHSVTVVWRTDVAAACSVAVRPAAGGSRTVVEGGADTTCVVALAGLARGTSYAYVPQADGVPLEEESTFRTDDPARPYVFLVVGDSGNGGGNQFTVRERMLETHADFVLHTGDMVYEEGAAEDFDPHFFAPYADLLRTMVLWPSLGNHDLRTADGAPWYEAFHTPANNPAGDESYYSFGHGNAHVVVLNAAAELGPGSPQRLFVEADLAASTARWKFVVFHQSVYSSGLQHASDLSKRALLVPLIDAHGVDVVFMGNDHIYERTHPLREDRVVAPGEGAVYVTTGGGGHSLHEVGTSAFTAWAESVFHFVRVTVEGDALTLQMIRDDATVGDNLSLQKDVGPVPHCGDDLVNRSDEECDEADALACVAACAPDCTCAPACGDGLVNGPTEECDGDDHGACPGLCLAGCVCGDTDRVVYLAPVADTFVEAGAEALLDHGASNRLHVDRSPPSVVYLKFDLSGIARPVLRSTLALFCTNASFDGGTVYRVGDSSWVEGTQTRGLGPGLRWVDVDTDGDQELTDLDTSPYLPLHDRHAGVLSDCVDEQLSTAEVTGAFEDGPGLYTIAVVSHSDDGASYSSREDGNAGERPRLRLELGDLPTTSTVSSTSTSSLVASSTTTTTTSTVPPTTAPPSPPPPCEPALCDDADPCTVDRCADVGCLHEPAPGIESVRCALVTERMVPAACAAWAMPRAVPARVARARRLLERVAAAPGTRSAPARLRRSARHLARAARIAARAVGRGQLSAECARDLGVVLEDAGDRAIRLALSL
jgi:hypothetical protein